MQIACVLVPHFPARVECQRRPDMEKRPLLVVEAQGSRRTVLDCLMAAGVHPGMPLPQALAKAKDAALLDADLTYYQDVFNRTLDNLESLSPLVEPAELGCAYVGLDGLEDLYGGRRALLQSLLGGVPSSLEPRIGVAPVKFPARVAASNAGPGKIAEVEDGAVREFLAAFPVEALPVSLEMKERLRKFGLRTIGQIASLPQGPLMTQFGPEGRTAWEIATGMDSRPLIPRKHEETIQECISFLSPTYSLVAILTAVEVLLGRACSSHQLRNRYFRAATLHGYVSGWGLWQKRIAFHDPVGDKQRAFFSIKSMLAQTKFPGPLDDIVLTLSGLTGESGRQGRFFSEVRKWDQLREAVRQLEVRLGRRPPVYFIREIEPWSRLPERRRALVPFDP